MKCTCKWASSFIRWFVEFDVRSMGLSGRHDIYSQLTEPSYTRARLEGPTHTHIATFDRFYARHIFAGVSLPVLSIDSQTEFAPDNRIKILYRRYHREKARGRRATVEQCNGGAHFFERTTRLSAIYLSNGFY